MKKNIKLVNSIEDFKGLKKYTPIQYTCRNCGKTVVRDFLGHKIKIISRFLCRYCNVEATNKERYGVKSTLSVPEVQEKIKETMKDIYGVDHPFKSNEIHRRSKQTMRDRYGVDNPMKSEEIRAKAEETNLRKYGNRQIGKCEVIRKKIKATVNAKYDSDSPFGSKEVQEKAKETIRSKYGVENVMQNKDIHSRAEETMEKRYGLGNCTNRVKAKRTMKDRYGVEHPMQSPEIMEKIKATNLAKYGVENTFLVPEIRERIEQTLLKKYGVNCMFRHPDVIKYVQKNRRGRYLYDGERFDSSWELALWIYAKDHGEEIERVSEPLEYYEEGKKHLYFPDFKYKGQLIEVKGDQFMNNGTMINPFNSSQNDQFAAKQQCAIDNGVKFMYQEDMMPYINYCRMKYAYKTWYHMYAIQYMWLQWLYNYSFMHDFTPFSTNVFEREGMEFVDYD